MRIADIIAMGALVVVILVVAIIVGNLYSVNETIAGSINDASYNATTATLFSNTWAGLTLASIGIIIAAAVGLIALILGALSPQQGRPV